MQLQLLQQQVVQQMQHYILPAIANEIGIKFDLMDVAKIFKKTPYLADLKPGGKYVAKDMWQAGGVPMLLKTL